MTLREQIMRSSGLLVEEETSYLDKLKKLINGEAAAAIQYKYASKAIIGPNQSYLVKHFEEHSKEEWGHYDLLVDALMERGGHPELEIDKAITNALPETKELTDYSSEYLRKFFADAEENAIREYKAFYEEIKDGADTQDLADIISGIISDERDHRLDFVRIKEGE